MNKLLKNVNENKILKWLRYKNILNLIASELNQKDILKLRKISIEFNNSFKIQVKRKEIKFNKYIDNNNLKIVEKYNMSNINLDWCNRITDDGLKYLVNLDSQRESLSSKAKYVSLNYTWITEEGLEALYSNGKINISRKAFYTKC